MDKERFHSIEDRCIWRGKCNEHTWSYGFITDILYCENIACIDNKISVNADTLGQYIGRKDKNGVEIYEGDVITCNGKYPKLVQYRKEKNAFCIANVGELKDSDYLDVWQHPFKGWWETMNIEIVGNIYDNPELLEKAERGDLIK